MDYNSIGRKRNIKAISYKNYNYKSRSRKRTDFNISTIADMIQYLANNQRKVLFITVMCTCIMIMVMALLGVTNLYFFKESFSKIDHYESKIEEIESKELDKENLKDEVKDAKIITSPDYPILIDDQDKDIDYSINDEVNDLYREGTYISPEELIEGLQKLRDTESEVYALPPVLYDYTIEISEKYNVDPVLIFSIMRVESKFNINADHKTNRNGSLDYSLCGINSCNKELFDKIGLDPYNNPYDNIEACAVLLNWWNKITNEINGNIHTTLMMYNGGKKYVLDCMKNGESSSKYSQVVNGFYIGYKKVDDLKLKNLICGE